MSQSSASVNDLFQTAKEEGSLSPAALNALNVVDIGAQINNAMGVNVDDIQSSEVVLVSIMVDDSGSIRFDNNSQTVRDGHNMVLDALNASKQGDSILAHTRYLNGHILFPYSGLDDAVRLDTSNYNPNLGTPLYDQSVPFLGTVLAKTQEFSDNGVPARSVSLIVTDGGDEHSMRANADTVKTIVEDMLMRENHIIAFMGIKSSHYDATQIATDMGIRPEWILTPDNDPSDIRKAFEVFSKSAVAASQNAGQFSQTAIGGFGG